MSSGIVVIKPSGAPLESYLSQLGLSRLTVCGVKAVRDGEEWIVLNSELPERPELTEAEVAAEYEAVTGGDVRDEGGFGFTAAQIERGDIECDLRRGN